MKKIIVLAIVCIASVALLAGGAWGEEFCVSTATELQDALTDAADNDQDDTIKVVQGTYNGNFTYNSGEGDGVTLRGGYTAGCTDRVVDPANTVLHGGGAGSGSVLHLSNSNGGNIYVAGFTMQNGADADEGGGVCASSFSNSGTAGTVSLINNIVTGNNAWHGGGVWASSHSVHITAGGVYLINNIVTGNDGDIIGGVVAISGSEVGTGGDITLTNNTITGNTSLQSGGGGVYVEADTEEGTTGDITLTNNTITGNTSLQSGGGVYASVAPDEGTAGDITLTNNTITGNTSLQSGGGVYASVESDEGTAGGITLTNNTITENNANYGGGSYLRTTGDNTINCYNNIIWGNTAATTADDIYLYKSGGTAYGYNNDYHELAGSWTDSGNNIDTDPCFTYPAAGNYHLQPTSSCIDAGNGSAPELPDYDFEGDARTIGADPDIGADECATTVWYVDGDVSSSGDGTTWGTAFQTIQEAIFNPTTSDGDEIWVKQGTYNLSWLITVDKAVGLFGGFAGTETKRNQRNWKAQVTTLNQEASVSCFQVWDDAIIDGFTITNGDAGWFGGGIYSYQCAPAIGNCIFSGNSANSGGGIFNDQSSSTIINCTFVDNDATFDGGGIYNDECTPTIINCIFAGNSAVNCGGGIFNYNAAATITNCTFNDNTAYSGGGIFNDSSSPAITNTILWGDSATTSQEICDTPGSAPTVTYCDVQGGYSGTGNIDANPRFVDAGGGNYHLQAGSDCIDAGTDTAPELPEYDFEGNPRTIGSAPDMGADEYNGLTPCDYDADGQTDIGVYRPSTGAWYLKRSTLGSQTVYWGGNVNDVPTPEDYDGDGGCDLTVYRSTTGWWYIKGVGSYLYGAAGDIPIPADYDGDGAIDFGVYRPSTGWWYVKDVGQFLFGGLADDIPVPGDYDGDGTIDVAVYRSSTGWWYIKGVGQFLFGGLADDIPVPGDYDGDGTTDIALFRPSTGWWYIKDVGSYLHGQSGDIPVPGDYDGDGVSDIAVFRPSNGKWYIKGASTFPIWGESGDTPLTRNIWIWQETGLLP